MKKTLRLLFVSLILLMISCGTLGGFPGTYADSEGKPVLIINIDGTGSYHNQALKWSCPDPKHIVLIFKDGKKDKFSFADDGKTLLTIGVDDDGEVFPVMIGVKQ